MRVPGAVNFFAAARATHAVYGSIVVLAVVTGLGLGRALAWSAVLTGCGVGLVELKKLAGH